MNATADIDLKGKIIQYFRDGYRMGRIVRFRRLKRTGAVTEITVREPSYAGKNRFGWNGKKVKLTPKNWTGQDCGIRYRGQIRPLT